MCYLETEHNRETENQTDGSFDLRLFVPLLTKAARAARERRRRQRERRGCDGAGGLKGEGATARTVREWLRWLMVKEEGMRWMIVEGLRKE